MHEDNIDDGAAKRPINRLICDRVWENRSYRHNNWYPFFACTWKLHSCTIQKHQVYTYLIIVGQVCFYRRLFTNAVKPPGCISWPWRALIGLHGVTRLLLTAVLTSLVDSTSLWPILRAQHCCMSPNGCFNLPSASHPPPHPPPTRPPL